MSDAPKRDWLAWHRPYDDPTSSLARRLATVQQEFARALGERSGAMRVISMCAGQGRDVLPVLAAHPGRNDVSAWLVELDPRNVAIARGYAETNEIGGVRVRQADAALADSYADATPADIILVCGVFGNIANDDVRRTIDCLPCLCAAGATVLWTRGHEKNHDIALDIRKWFAAGGLDELAFHAPDEKGYRVGECRLIATPRPFDPGVTLFKFIR